MLNPRDMQKAMKRMGIKQEEIEATEVIIRCPDKEIIITQPQVAKVNMMGQESFQISGTVKERAIETTPEISEDDIKTVMEQTDTDREKALDAIQENKGDLAQAILSLSQ